MLFFLRFLFGLCFLLSDSFLLASLPINLFFITWWLVILSLLQICLLNLWLRIGSLLSSICGIVYKVRNLTIIIRGFLLLWLRFWLRLWFSFYLLFCMLLGNLRLNDFFLIYIIIPIDLFKIICLRLSPNFLNSIEYQETNSKNH